MKKILLYIFLGTLTMGAIAWANSAGEKFRKGQSEISSLPACDLLQLDSTSLLKTQSLAIGHPVVLLYFSPDCEHCQAETKIILDNIDALARIRVYLFSPMPIDDIKRFCKQFNIDKYKNITVAQDYKYAIYNHLKITSYPCIAIYNDRLQLIKLYRHEIPFGKILGAIRS